MSRFSLACHEAGHATAAVLLDRKVDGCSIVLGDGYRGVVTHTRREAFAHEAGAPVWPVFQMVWRTRFDLERSLVIVLAGPVAERVYGQAEPSSGYVAPTTDEEQVHAAVERLDVYSREERQRLEDAATDPDGTDLARTFKLAALCSSGPTHAREFLAWFEHEAEAWIRSPQFRIPLVRVVEALLERNELTGGEVVELVHPTTKEKQRVA